MISILKSLHKSGAPGFRGTALFWFAVVMLVADAGCVHQQEQMNTKLDKQSQDVSTLSGKVDGFEKELKVKQEIFADLAQRVKQDRADVTVMMQDLRIEIQGLRGDLEELRHENQQLNMELQRLRGDVQDKELNKLSASGENDAAVYEKILKIVLDEKDYNLAIEQFEDFIKKYPKSTLADNAAYWIGEGYYALGTFDKAILNFDRVVQKYPKSEKMCGAILKQGFSFEALKKPDQAKLFFEETVAKCKESKEATTASSRLTALKSTPPPAAKKK